MPKTYRTPPLYPRPPLGNSAAMVRAADMIPTPRATDKARVGDNAGFGRAYRIVQIGDTELRIPIKRRGGSRNRAASRSAMV